MDIVLFGIQGSGKGTLGKTLSQKFGFQIFETGSELRKLSQENSALAQKVKSIVEAGKLVPNEVVMDIIENFMQNLEPHKKVLFDGIPRKMSQAETFDALMQRLGRNFKGILIDVPKEIALKRLSTRRICTACKKIYPATYPSDSCDKCGRKLGTRSDDNPESIKNRVEAYFEETVPVIEHYKKAQKMIVMNGDQSIEDAAKKIIGIVEKEIL